jgi:hypothetical protein
VLRAIHAKYSPVAYQAIIMPILDEIGRRTPVPPRQRAAGYAYDPESDPLRAGVWPPR